MLCTSTIDRVDAVLCDLTGKAQIALLSETQIPLRNRLLKGRVRASRQWGAALVRLPFPMREAIMKSSLTFVLPSFLSFTLVIAAAPAVAKPVSGLEPTTVNVDYSDLDLSSDAGVATLGVRVRSAIKRACPEMTRDLRQQAVARKCRTALT